MPRFHIGTSTNWTTFDVTPPIDGVTTSFGPLMCGQGIAFEKAAAADAQTVTLVAKAAQGTPALRMIAYDTGLEAVIGDAAAVPLPMHDENAEDMDLEGLAIDATNGEMLMITIRVAA